MTEPSVIHGAGYVIETEIPTVLPVSLDEVQSHCRVESAEDSAWLIRAVRVATTMVERSTRRRLISRAMQWRIPSFGPRHTYLGFPVAPLREVTEVRYTPPSGGEQVVIPPEEYTVETYRTPAAIGPALGREWPETVRYGWAVTVDLVAGYGAAAADIDERLRQAILLMVAHMYEHRGEQMAGVPDISAPPAALALIRPLRLGMVG